jgi:hypothetical protein
MGRYANSRNILSQHARFLLDRGEAEKIVNDMKAGWRQLGTHGPCKWRLGKGWTIRGALLSGVFPVSALVGERGRGCGM